MSTTTTGVQGRTPTARNGVDTPVLFATIDTVGANPHLARFQFRATNEWVNGTHSRSTIQGFYGAGQEDASRTEPFTMDADHPAVLVGSGEGPTPVEFLLHAIAACLTAGVANIAAARGVTLTRVESRVTGDIDILGLLGLDDTVRNGYEAISVDIRISGDAPDDVLRGIVERSRARSAVYDVLTNGIPVQVNVEAV
jgi:uncharacterized OsmC-like protein